MTTMTTPASAAARPSDLSRRFRTRLTAGMILVVPVWVTFVIVSVVFKLLRDASLWILEAVLLSKWGAPLIESWGFRPEDLQSQGLDALPVWLRWVLGIVAVVLTIIAIYLLGSLATNLVGRRMISKAERVLDRLPIVKTVYRASKQVLETFAGDGGARGFTRVALVPFPSKEVCSVGFVTARTVDRASGEEYCSVFVSTTPNPTTGFLFLIKRTDLIELDWTTDEAVKAVMSAGVLLGDSISLGQRLGDGAEAPPTGAGAGRPA
jgi:uncharacterized membrane protein